MVMAAAPVQRWNAHSVCVRCPYCTKVHTHGFDGNYKDTMRAAHCSSSPYISFPSYSFAYPFSLRDGTTAYEIDKSAEFFIALDADTATEATNIEQALTSLDLDDIGHVRQRSLEDANETIVIGDEDKIFRRLHAAFGGDDTFTMKRLDHVLSQMLLFGDRKCVEDYMRTSHEVEIFLHGVDEKGDTVLHLAACERYPEIVELLLRHGTDINARNGKGRSPLMEAALWGRIDNVKHLLERGADKDLRDIYHRSAIDLAQQSSRNDEERYLRSGGQNQVYHEVTYTANQARRVIFELLKDQQVPANGNSSIPDPSFQMHLFRKSDQKTIQLVAPVAEFSISEKWKTIASLQRSPPYPPVAAMSGWSHGNTIVTVSGKDWTDEVIRVSGIVGHELEGDEGRDHGVKGRFFASHAEKQLIAYFISKHVLLDRLEPEVLQLAKPPVTLNQTTILVSRPPCKDCLSFIDTINFNLDLRISVLDRAEGWEARNRIRGNPS